jgi:hypothetical protein
MHFQSLTCVLALGFGAYCAHAFEPPVMPLIEVQMQGFKVYEAGKPGKAFAAGPGGAFAHRSGFVSSAVAAREALAECDAAAKTPQERCILIDLDGQPVAAALQWAQRSRADAEEIDKPVPLGDLRFDLETWAAIEGLKAKKGHKAFAISLRGPWARAWEAASPEEAEKQALDTCNKKEKAAGAPCFLLILDDVPVPPENLLAGPGLTVTIGSGSIADR